MSAIENLLQRLERTKASLANASADLVAIECDVRSLMDAITLPGGGTLDECTIVARVCASREDSERANREWKATCGPHAIAAACGKSLEEVRSAMMAAGINYRGWMSPTMVSTTVHALGRDFTLRKGLKTLDLCNGINRVQWEGKWLNPGVPARVAYFHTHLVAHFDGIVLCTACQPNAWIPVENWRSFHLEIDPSSPFHITHHWNIA